MMAVTLQFGSRVKGLYFCAMDWCGSGDALFGNDVRKSRYTTQNSWNKQITVEISGTIYDLIPVS